MSKLMQSCEDAARLSSQSMDAPLALWERALLRMHLTVCRQCSNFTRQMDFLRRASRKLPDTLDKDDD